ncbi:MAG: FkbM family methyltransferase, partial [Saprospiraceae bacterium]|nr:FkbM family methyltransferase [Saprospiraceae bacterium]
LDKNELAYLCHHLNRGEVAVDIGEHKGGYLYWMRKKVGKEGKVYAFEPQELLFDYLNQIKQLNAYENVTLENLAMSNAIKKVDFFIPVNGKASSPGARIGQAKTTQAHKKIDIQTTTLDHYFLDKGIQPSLIKIDVEGHEKEVLLGGQKLLAAAQPKILMECETRHLINHDIFEVFKVLTHLGYKGYFFEHNQLRPIHEFQVDKHQKVTEGRYWTSKNYVNNFIFEF